MTTERKHLAADAIATKVAAPLLDVHNMIAEERYNTEWFARILTHSLLDQMDDRDHWSVGGIEYGDRLVVLSAMLRTLMTKTEHPENAA